MGIIEFEIYIDVRNLPSQEARDAYDKFARECGLANGERWPWVVGEHGDDCTPEGYITAEEVESIHEALRRAGLSDGEEINLMKWW